MKAQSMFTKKSITMLVFMLCLGLMTPVITMAQKSGGYSGPSSHGGYNGPGHGPAVTPINGVHKLPDDSWVTLRGKIIRHEGGKIYTFQDASGKGKVEIDKKAWGGLNINPHDTVELRAKIDKERNHIEIEVEHVRKVK